MNTFRVLLVASFAAAAAALDCGAHGEGVDGCCVCFPGWQVGNTGTCSVCAEGYLLDAANDVCSNGRKDAPCVDTLEYPYWGCNKGGMQIGKCSAGGVFPCECAGGNCEQTAAELSDTCYPAGPRMYTPFPNQAIVGMPHSLTIVGCGLTATDKYAVIPAYTSDLSAERPCSSLGANATGGISPLCSFTAGQAAVIGGNTTQCSGKNGFLITGLAEGGPAVSGMSERTFKEITVNDEVLGGTMEDRATNNVERQEKETYFRVCKLTKVAAADGTFDDAWAEVASHNHEVTARDSMYKLSKEENYDPTRASAAAENGDGDDCCDGLKLGSLCLPLWVLLLLWLLMACCLGAMGYTLHKNKNEIEAQKNNEKYEKFNVDAEMSAMAAKQAEDDDDI